jgi:ribosomal protein L24E
MFASTISRTRVAIVCAAITVLTAAALAVAPTASAAPRPGYWLLGGDGGVFSFQEPYFGSAAPDGTRCAPNTTDRDFPNGTCVSIAATPNGGGYWILNGDKLRVFRFGNAGSYGDPESSFAGTPREFVPTGLQIVSTPTGHGYWVMELNLSGAATIAHFGDAGAFGDSQTLVSHTHRGLNGTPVGMAAMPDGTGYWEVHSDGGVFSFGAAKFYGSLGATHVASKIVGIASTNDGKGYWVVTADGTVYPFGDATHFASLTGKRLAQPVAGIAANRVGSGVWLVARDGGVFALGGAPFLGSMGGKHLNRPVVAITSPNAVI